MTLRKEGKMTKKYNKDWHHNFQGNVHTQDKNIAHEQNIGKIDPMTDEQMVAGNTEEDTSFKANTDVDAENKQSNDQEVELKNLEHQLDLERANTQQYIHIAQQLQSDFDNYRKRNANIAKESKQEGVNNAVTTLLPAYDALIEGLKMINDPNVKKGLEMVERVFVQALSDLDIHPMDTLNKTFDPKFHNVLTTEEVENVESGTIIQEFSKGFVSGDGTVVRVATVKTAK